VDIVVSFLPLFYVQCTVFELPYTGEIMIFIRPSVDSVISYQPIDFFAGINRSATIKCTHLIVTANWSRFLCR